MSEAKAIIESQVSSVSPQGDSSVMANAIEAEQRASAGDPVQEAVEQQQEANQSQGEEKKENDLFSSKFAALSRKEKELRRKEAELEEKLRLKEAELEDKLSGFQGTEAFQSQLKENPLKVLSDLGVTYDDLTQMALNEGSPTTEMLLKRQEEQFKQQLEDLRNEYLNDKKSAEEEKYNQVIDNFVNEITNFVNTNETYELIRAQDAVGLVYDVIEEYHEESGRILDVKEAADAVEQYLENQARELLSIKKLGFSQAEAEQIMEAKAEGSEQKQPGATLSNEQTTVVPNQRTKKLSKEESLARAAALLKWDD